MPSLVGRKVLVAEDDYLVAADLAHGLSNVGAVVLGPVPTLHRAMSLARKAEVAVLDINLQGQTVYPLADVLADRGIPYVFFSAYQLDQIPQRFHRVNRIQKPSQLPLELERMLEAESDDRSATPSDIEKSLPRLRLLARLYVQDPEAADRIVEKTLMNAIAEHANRDTSVPVDDWLANILCREAGERGHRRMI